MNLRSFVQEKNLIEPGSWQEFVDELVEIYRLSEKILAIDNFFSKLSDKKISELSEPIREKVQVALAGGYGSESPFSKFMYETFGIFTGDVNDYDESVKFFTEYPEYATLKKDYYLKGQYTYTYLVSKFHSVLKELLDFFRKKGFVVELNSENMNPEDFLPFPDEKPTKIINLFNEYKERIAKLTIGYNPYTTFAAFSRLNFVGNLIDYFGTENKDKLKDFLSFMDIKLINPLTLEKEKNLRKEALIYADYKSLCRKIFDISIFPLKEKLVNSKLRKGYKDWVFSLLKDHKIEKNKESLFIYY